MRNSGRLLCRERKNFGFSIDKEERENYNCITFLFKKNGILHIYINDNVNGWKGVCVMTQRMERMLKSLRAKEHRAVRRDVEFPPAETLAELSPAPVSYTHLDVYKRQVLCASARS